jgi:hypothetical protein
MNIGEESRYKALRQALRGAGLDVLNITRGGKKTVLTVAHKDTGNLSASKTRRLTTGSRLPNRLPD